MGLAQSLACPVGCHVAQSLPGASVVGGSAPFNPDTIPTILQNLGSPLTYRESLLSGLPVLESSVGASAGAPRGQRCVLFDGSNDHATLAGRLTAGSVTQLTISFWLRTTAALGTVVEEYAAIPNYQWLVYLWQGKLRFLTSSNGTSVSEVLYDVAINDNTWRHFTITYNAGTVAIYVNGVAVSTSGSATASLANAAGIFRIGGLQGGGYLVGRMYDVRAYNTAKDSVYASSVANQHLTPTTLDRTGLLGAWWLQEEAGTVHYDWSGNGRNLTATNVTTSTYHATDTGVLYNAANELGYTLSGSTAIPRNEAIPAQDAAGGALQFAGPVKLPGVCEVPCVTVTGTEYLSIAHLTGSETVVSSVGTSTPSIAAGRINLTAGTISSIVLSDGTTLPLQEGPGTSNTNRTCHNVDGTARHATLTNGAVASLWAARLNTVEDWCVNYGGGIAANGAFVPGILGSPNDAAGNAKTLQAGKHGNPYSRLLQNHFDAPSLVNIGSTSADKYAPGYDVQSETTADTRARRTAASGDDRYVAFREALAGTDLTNVEEWTS